MAATDATHMLQNTGVLVTRPSNQADAFMALIAAAGGRAWHFPMVEIAPLPDSDGLDAVRARLDDYDFAIFISPNAVHHGYERIRAARAWPERVTIAGVGPGTAMALSAAGHYNALMPLSRYSSEGLLERAEFQRVSGKKIVIFRGRGGRELLATTLRERGAAVDYAECYERRRPALDNAALARLFGANRIQITTASSPDALRHLAAAAETEQLARLLSTPVVVASLRMADLAHTLEFTSAIVTAENATDQAMLAALVDWRASTTV